MSVSKEPLSIRNNNPGNLRFVGQEGATQGEGGFARFDSPEAGMAAMRRQLELDTQERGMTLSAFLNKYAPPSENKTSNYIDFVAKKTGLDPSSVVPADRIGDLQRAMIEMEGGPRSLGHFMQTKVAEAPKATTKPGPRTTAQAPKTERLAMADLTQMPDSYRAALAANYLADTEGETDITSKAMELLDEAGLTGGAGGTSGGKVLQQYYAQPGVDPFQFVQAQEEAPRRAVPRMPVKMKDGGEVENEFSAEDRLQQLEMQRDRIAGGLRYDFGPMSAQAVRKPQGYEARVSTPVGPIVPYMDFDPLSGSFRPTEVGATTGQMGPQGGYTLKYAQPFVDGQQMPPQVSGAYRRQFDKDSSLEASGFYSPIPGGKDAYGANLRYVRRFAEGGQAQKFTDEQVSQYLKERPELTDRQIAEAMNKYNVSQEQVSRVTGVTMPEVQRRYREATALTARPTLEGVGALWNKLHEAQFGTPVNLAISGRENVQAQVTELQKEAARQQAEWDAKYGAGMPKQAAPMPTWGDTYNAWAPLYEQRFGTMINRPWNADVDAQNQKLALDQQYIQAVRDYNTKYGTNYAPEESVLGINAQPNIYFYAPEKSNKGIKTLLGAAGTLAGMYYFPGMDPGNMFSRALITAGTEGAKRLFNEGGEVVYREDGSPPRGEVAPRAPSLNEVPQVDIRGRVIRDVPVPQPTFTPGQQLIGAGETALSALSGLTAPASIAYDVLRGVPAKEVSPGRFMYEPRTEAGQETLQNVGRLAQEYKLDAALPQVQLQRPYPVAAAARQGIAGIEKGVEKMTLPTFRKITGNPEATKEQMMDFVLNQKSIMQAGAPAIVKPKGGTFVSGEHSTFDNALEDITSSINREKQNWGYAADAGDVVKKLETISDFFNTRFKNYYQKKLGSQDDPLRDAFLRGDFNGGDWFNVQELNDIRARIANPQTSSAQKEELLRLLNSKYDAWTDINAIVPERNSIGKKLAYPSSESVNVIQKKLKEQGVNVDKKDISVTAETRDNYLIGDKGLNAINQGDVAYDVGSSPTLSERAALIKDYLMTLNPNQVKNITFEDAIIGAERYHEALKNPAIKFTPQELFEGREKMFNAGDKYQWSEIKTVEALKREGLAMDHCIQGDDYCMQLTSGIGRHFSLQDAKTGIPHTTISTYRSPFAGPESKHVVIGQIKGHSNSVASKYFDEVEKFLTEYEKQVGKIYITEKPKFIPPAFKKAEYTTLPRGYEGNQYAKGGIVDKPLYDRAA